VSAGGEGAVIDSGGGDGNDVNYYIILPLFFEI